MIGFPLMTSLALKHTSSAHASVSSACSPRRPRLGRRPRRRAPVARVLAGGGRRPGRRARLRRHAGRRRHRAGGPAGARRGRARRARLRRGRRAHAQLRRLAGDLLGARLHRAVPRVPGDARRAARSARGRDAWLGFAYVAVISMFLGFFAWYHALALGGVAKIGQVQLAQPVLTLFWAALDPRRDRHRRRCSSPHSPCSPACWRRSARAAAQPTTERRRRACPRS